jgi:hypothetical protein
MTTKILPPTVTTLDLIKCFALICMVIDHIGFYFFPDQMWLRAVGRFGGAPVWFFLIGYAQSRHIPNTWFIGAVILASSDFLLFQHMFPLNVLMTLLFLRLGIDHIMNFLLRSRYIFWFISILLAFCYMASNMVIEYGTLAVLSAIAGYMARHREKLFELSSVTKYDFIGFCVFITIANAMLQTAVFGFDQAQFIFVGFGLSVFLYVLVTMKSTTFPQFGFGVMAKSIQYTGRHTLEIYVAHLVIFKVLAFGLRSVGIL